MASSCNNVPTLTTTVVQTTQSTRTIVTNSVSVGQPTTSAVPVSTSTICPTVTRTDGSASTPSCTLSTVMSSTVIPGTTMTVQVTQTSLEPVTNTVISTLFGTTCVAVSSGEGTTVMPTTSSSTSTSTSASSSSTTTSPPPVNTSTLTSMSTASDGSIYTMTETTTYAQTSTSSSSGVGASGASGTNSSNIGAIVGGAVGGVVVLSAIVLLIWWLMRRRTNWDDIFENEGDINHGTVFPVSRRDPPPDPNPKPYEYGLVGHVPPTSPPSSSGRMPSLDGPTVPMLGHYHQLSDPFSQQASLGQEGPFQQLQQQVGPGQQGPLSQQQQVGPGQQGTLSQQQQQVGTGHQSSYSQQQVGPSHQDPFPQQQQIGNAPQDVRPMSSVSDIPVIPIPNPNTWIASGSGWHPYNMQNNSNVRQALDSGPITRPSTAASRSSHALSHPSVTASTVANTHEFDPYMEEQEHQLLRERRDGKGRLVTLGEKRPIVHLDGGRYREPGASRPTESVASPPAYTA